MINRKIRLIEKETSFHIYIDDRLYKDFDKIGDDFAYTHKNEEMTWLKRLGANQLEELYKNLKPQEFSFKQVIKKKQDQYRKEQYDADLDEFAKKVGLGDRTNE